ncbi:MAG: DUF262 domain-containing protein [Aestuariivita sp.]|nr:DUF262 domain-containing protein [Aestuariivita sp.]
MAQQDISIQQLVDKIENNEIRLPEMQRQYVWQSTRVRDLLDSLYRGYPSGTILTWETNEQVATRAFAVDQNVNMPMQYQLLLDGQQRLTSLSAILRGEPVQVRGRKRPIDILFNLEHPDALQFITEVNENDSTDSSAGEDTSEATEDELLERFNKMAFVVHAKKLAVLPHWVSVTKVFKENSDASILKAAGITFMDDPRYDKFTDRLKKLRAIKDYNYRVHILEREKSYEEVTEIFVRVNSLGAKLRSSDLALAQITAKWRDSLKIFQDFERECDQKGFPLDVAILLRNLIAFATGQSKFRAITGLSRNQLEDNWKTSIKGMEYSIDFLKSNVGIESPALLSSNFILIVIALLAHRRNYNFTPDFVAQLRKWVLLANVKGRYSHGSSETLLDQDLTAINQPEDLSILFQRLRTQVGSLDIHARDFENRNSQSGYFKTMFLAFQKDGATDWRDQLKISLKHIGKKHRLQFHHVFPQAVLKRVGADKHNINDICNFSFISERTNRKISDKEPADYLSAIVDKLGEEGLLRQCIPIDRQLWSVDRYQDFLQARRELVAKRMSDFIASD